MKFTKELYNISEVCSIIGVKVPEHIKTNNKLSRIGSGEFDIIRQSSHDGTLIFTIQLLARSVEPLLNKTAFYTEANMDGVTDVEYEIGLISLATVFGLVNLPVGNCKGEKQRVRIPVRCNLIRN